MTGSGRAPHAPRRLAVLACVCLVACLGTGAAAGHPRIEITPAHVLEGDPVSVRVTGLAPGTVATLRAESVMPGDDGRLQLYRSVATFEADAHGAMDLATAAPLRGDYRGADVRGLFWSQRPVTGPAAAPQRVSEKPPAPGEVVFTLEMEGAKQASGTLTFMRDPGTMREEVHADGLVGVFYHAKDARRCPVVVVFGGSEGGLDVADWAGPRLAARGYAVFGVDYFNPPGDAVAGVPSALKHIPVELLEKARAWLGTRPEADVSRLGLLGYSKGGEFTLVLASTYPWIKAVVAYAPADYVWQGIEYRSGTLGSSWSQAGHDLPFLPTTGTREAIQAARGSGGRVTLAAVAKANLAAASPGALAAARIGVERSHAALLLIGGDDDQLWDSGASVERLAVELKRAAYPHPYASLLYPGAGHAVIGTGWRPTTTDDGDFFRNGGTPKADARAQADSWPKVLAFLERELQLRTPGKPR